MALAHPIGFAVQNVFNHWSFFALLLVSFVFLGAVWRLLLAFLLASLASALHSLFFLNRLSAHRCTRSPLLQSLDNARSQSSQSHFPSTSVR